MRGCIFSLVLLLAVVSFSVVDAKNGLVGGRRLKQVDTSVDLLSEAEKGTSASNGRAVADGSQAFSTGGVEAASQRGGYGLGFSKATARNDDKLANVIVRAKTARGGAVSGSGFALTTGLGAAAQTDVGGSSTTGSSRGNVISYSAGADSEVLSFSAVKTRRDADGQATSLGITVPGATAISTQTGASARRGRAKSGSIINANGTGGSAIGRSYTKAAFGGSATAVTLGLASAVGSSTDQLTVAQSGPGGSAAGGTSSHIQSADGSSIKAKTGAESKGVSVGAASTGGSTSADFAEANGASAVAAAPNGSSNARTQIRARNKSGNQVTVNTGARASNSGTAEASGSGLSTDNSSVATASTSAQNGSARSSASAGR